MGLEYRNGRAYYYEKVRSGRQVFSRYVCGGEDAELLARINGLKQDQAETERYDRQSARKRDAEEEQELKTIESAIDVLLAEFYTTHGYHFEKGEWRHGRQKRE